jgi:hypothetical protein
MSTLQRRSATASLTRSALADRARGEAADLAQHLRQTRIKVYVVGAAGEDQHGFAGAADDDSRCRCPAPCGDVAASTPAFILYTRARRFSRRRRTRTPRSRHHRVSPRLRADGESLMVVHDSVSHMGG